MNNANLIGIVSEISAVTGYATGEIDETCIGFNSNERGKNDPISINLKDNDKNDALFICFDLDQVKPSSEMTLRGIAAFYGAILVAGIWVEATDTELNVPCTVFKPRWKEDCSSTCL